MKLSDALQAAAYFVHPEASALIKLAIRHKAASTSPAFFRQFERNVHFFAALTKQKQQWN